MFMKIDIRHRRIIFGQCLLIDIDNKRHLVRYLRTIMKKLFVQVVNNLTKNV